MGKKVMNVVLFIAVLAAAIGMTVFVGRGAMGVMIYNFVFLGIMTVVYLAGLFGGMFRLNELAQGLARGTESLISIFKIPGKTDTKNLTYLKDIFDHNYLDKKIDNFTESIHKSEMGIGDIEEYISEEEIDLHIHKRLLEMVPDIFTSLGILGTFVGLVWGLKNFEPSNYEAMTSSVSMLVDGIKVAFLTSIYGISFSIIYTIGMKSEYSGMSENLQAFLEKFHAYVMPTAENESRNLMVASQNLQTRAVKQMAEQFSVQLSDSFEKVITPTFQKMNDSLDTLVVSVTSCQQDAVKEILNAFLLEMRNSFQMEFQDFNKVLDQLKKSQKDNIAYTNALYQSMSQQLNENFVKQEKNMHDRMTELSAIQNRFMTAAVRITQDNQEIQKAQKQDYQHIVDYLKDAERSAAKFWVACNQAMQKYVEAAAQSMDKTKEGTVLGNDLIKSNTRMVEEFQTKMQEFAEYQKLSYQTMEQVRRLLSDVSVTKNNKDVYLMAGSSQGADREAIRQLTSVIRDQAERQEALLEELNNSMKELSRTAQKGKKSIFNK